MADDRQSPRKVAKTNLVILMEPNNAATVLNVSDGGIGFRADRPIAQSGKIRFSFPENGQQIETSGELVWTDPTKQIGGLSFGSLPEEERERIRRWANQGDTPKNTRTPSRPAPSAPKEPPRPFVAPTRTNAAPIPSFPPPAIPLPLFSRPGVAQFESVPQRLGYAWEREMPIADTRPKFFRGFLAGVIVSAILAGVLYFVYGNSIKDLQKQLSEMIGASLKLQAAPAAVPPAALLPAAAVPPPLVSSGPAPSGGVTAPAASGPLPVSGDDSKNESAPAKIMTESPMANKHFTPAAESSPPRTVDPGAEDLALAQRYLTTMPGHTGSATATRYLWAAVEKGNVQAEITLADMYARGEGVTKNCNQAQVLLRAASKKGNTEASQELAQLIRSGCR